MKLSLPKWLFPIWTRNKSGENFYDLTSLTRWSAEQNNLYQAENHPILTPALLFVAKLFSQAKFRVIRKSNGKEFEHPLLKLLNNPNFYSTLPDLLESLLFTQIATGCAVLYLKRTMGMETPNSLYLLNYNLIEFPDELKEGNFINRMGNDKMLDTEIVYDSAGENKVIKLKDLMFFYDLPNGTHANPYEVVSRLDGLKQTLINTNDSLIAKNIILKTNGKELLSGNKEGFPLADDEKRDAENLFNTQYGLSENRKRGLITKASVTYQSLHIALRDLGLDESVKVDGNIIYTALHIPKDIISLEAKKTTYNNFKESMVSYIQNEIQPTLNSFIAVMQELVGDQYVLEGTYEHLPIMQFILIERYTGVKLQGEALSILRNAGVPDDVALEKCGFDKNLKLNELVVQEPMEDSDEEISEEKIREIIQNTINY